MTYTREELLNLNNASDEKFNEVTQALINKLINNEDLSLAESKFVCLGLKHTYSDDKSAKSLKAEDFTQCSDFLFWEKYLLYWDDHEGWGEIKNSDTTTISPERKIIDVALLQQHFEEWKNTIHGSKFGSFLLQTVATETIRLIKEVVDYSKSLGEGSNRHKYIEKALTLHSKYVYYQVREYYEENKQQEEILTLCGNLIVVDSFVYVHTLFAHFAADVKFNRPGKTYHRNGVIDFKNIPKEILSILIEYQQTVDCTYFNKQVIFFNLKSVDYAIWFRSMTKSLKGGITQDYLRVQTFYPVELLSDREKIKNMDKITVNDNLSFYVNL
ncbi:hypothetical protein [Mucilaginibacter pedocola]|uniref:Uncharacterized protein n=1 Tax=Mucilaginibacter pedocola TaxID=1792845 RepID=A0A1S9PEQ7_9SPHI|nr:hypothetical protein [Mucilaginibacter pedocola]OOQ59118.1 hypothetical protein BC343_29285 [Mucilaginibacter pedocola]